jgi:hypothetical protein
VVASRKKPVSLLIFTANGETDRTRNSNTCDGSATKAVNQAALPPDRARMCTEVIQCCLTYLSLANQIYRNTAASSLVDACVGVNTARYYRAVALSMVAYCARRRLPLWFRNRCPICHN